MKKTVEKFLKLAAKTTEKIAVKSCSATSSYDTYQPKIPDAVRKLKK